MSVAQRVTEFYASSLEVLDFIVSRTSDSLADILTKALPLVAPIPNAVSIFYVSQSALSYNAVQALAVAASIECMFFALTEVVLKSWELWHADKQYKLPLTVSVTAFFVYFLLVMSLVYMLEVSSGHSMAPLAFPVVSVVAAVALGVTRWHKRNAPGVSRQVRKPVSVTAKVAVTSGDSNVSVVSEMKPVEIVSDSNSAGDSDSDGNSAGDSDSDVVSRARKMTRGAVSERRSRLAQLMSGVEITTDTVAAWAAQLQASDRTIWRDIQALTEQCDSAVS